MMESVINNRNPQDRIMYARYTRLGFPMSYVQLSDEQYDEKFSKKGGDLEIWDLRLDFHRKYQRQK